MRTVFKGRSAVAAAGLLGLCGLAGLVWQWARRADFAVLNPKGIVAHQERSLLIAATLLMLLIVLPVFALTFLIAWKYRASNTTADYQPEWDRSRRLETIWWGFPCLIILILATITWNSSHRLDPYRPLASQTPAVTVQVVALQWKWLFLYPQQQIASLNYLELPVGTPINFEITADAPMNSFWIPQLGGQIYAMPGMTTELHLMADAPGNFRGRSANLSGLGFSSMQFMARARSTADFESWVRTTKQSGSRLDSQSYAQLAHPSIASSSSYAAYEHNLYTKIVMKYMPGMATIPASMTLPGTMND